MHQEFSIISKNQLSSRDAHQFIHQKVNKDEVIEDFLKKAANPEIENKIKGYKRSTSMVDIKRRKAKEKNEQQPTEQDSEDEDGAKRAKSIHIILRRDEEDVKISEIERKNMKKKFINNENDNLPEVEEEEYTDSKAA